ncbi:MAG: hypothetical protein ACO3A2_06460, partial [Bdellovibrionia bacterium]
MAQKFAFSMQGVGKIYPPNKQVLRDIYLSFYYGAKIGVLGQNGKGLSYKFSTNPSLFARIITFSKAYGTLGGAILGEKKV